jgi:GDP-D-mannose dehydratase
MKKAFITGVSGQDGSYLVDFLLEKGYEVHGLIRQSTQFTPDKWGYLSRPIRENQLQVQQQDKPVQRQIRMPLKKQEMNLLLLLLL